MSDEKERPDDGLSDAELAAEAAAEALPDREAMSLVRVPGPPGTELLLGDEVMPADLVGGGG
ncbi:MAG TPA: hypothetical protein VFQ85_19010 [Mycobacteriales bacterium]|jgi:hypothetical protein|nr:hypothetical protein [Mycobacteriales bacterium]